MSDKSSTISQIRAEVERAERDEAGNRASGYPPTRWRSRYIKDVAALLDVAEAAQEMRKALRECRANLLMIEVHCPCGARPESPSTHPHVIGCPVEAALANADAAIADESLKRLNDLLPQQFPKEET